MPLSTRIQEGAMLMKELFRETGQGRHELEEVGKSKSKLTGRENRKEHNYFCKNKQS